VPVLPDTVLGWITLLSAFLGLGITVWKVIVPLNALMVRLNDLGEAMPTLLAIHEAVKGENGKTLVEKVDHLDERLERVETVQQTIVDALPPDMTAAEKTVRAQIRPPKPKRR
jgi:hypothetical protein